LKFKQGASASFFMPLIAFSIGLGADMYFKALGTFLKSVWSSKEYNNKT
jgi:hypothetical protein